MKSFEITLVLFVILCSVCGYKGSDDWEESDELRTRASAAKRFYRTKEELELTKVDPHIDNKPCKRGQNISVFIHSAGRSQGKYFDKRQATRNTWVSELKKLNVSVYFVIALNQNETTNEELKVEADKYEDIIQFSFIDAYHNLTLKGISILRWIQKKCQTSTHILKTDDDIVVNSRLLLDKLSEFRTGITGKLHINPPPYREISDKYYIPSSVYPNETYPTFTSGVAYMMSGNITKLLLKTIDEYSGYVINMDEVFITGIIAEKAGIERHSTHLIKYVGCEDVCVLYESPVVFQCKDLSNMKEYWTEWKTTSYEYCRNMFYLKIMGFVVLGLVIVGAVVIGLGVGTYYIVKKLNSTNSV